MEINGQEVFAVCHVGYDTGVALMNIEYGIDDRIKCFWFSGDKNSKITHNKIHYSIREGGDYIIKHGRRWKISEFMRV